MNLIFPIVGLPNVGKSTIINALLGHKISIVTHKANTTRTIIYGSQNFNGAEVLFVDTPGFSNVKTKLGAMIFDSMKDYLDGLDEMILVLDAANPQIEKFASVISKSIVILNKIDYLRKPKLLPIIAQLQSLGAIEVFLISALFQDGMADLKSYIQARCADIPTQAMNPVDVDIKEYACECVREKLLTMLNEEIPYKIFVEAKEVHVPKDSAWRIMLNIVVPKKSYKPIILGKKSAMIKAIGIAARTEISLKLMQTGFLGLQIMVDEKLWEKAETYAKLGWK